MLGARSQTARVPLTCFRTPKWWAGRLVAPSDRLIVRLSSRTQYKESPANAGDSCDCAAVRQPESTVATRCRALEHREIKFKYGEWLPMPQAGPYVRMKESQDPITKDPTHGLHNTEPHRPESGFGNHGRSDERSRGNPDGCQHPRLRDKDCASVPSFPDRRCPSSQANAASSGNRTPQLK